MFNDMDPKPRVSTHLNLIRYHPTNFIKSCGHFKKFGKLFEILLKAYRIRVFLTTVLTTTPPHASAKFPGKKIKDVL